MNSHLLSKHAAEDSLHLRVFREADHASDHTVRLDEQLSAMEHEVRSMAPARIGVQIGGLHERGFPRIALPATQLEGLMRHLVIDALDAMPAGGTLSIFIEHCTGGVAYPIAHPDPIPGEYVALSVCDSGGGASDLSALGSSRPAPSFMPSLLDKGRALGLSAAFEAIQVAGGDLVVSHRPYETAVRLYFPVVGGG